MALNLTDMCAEHNGYSGDIRGDFMYVASNSADPRAEFEATYKTELFRFYKAMGRSEADAEAEYSWRLDTFLSRAAVGEEAVRKRKRCGVRESRKRRAERVTFLIEQLVRSPLAPTREQMYQLVAEGLAVGGRPADAVLEVFRWLAVCAARGANPCSLQATYGGAPPTSPVLELMAIPLDAAGAEVRDDLNRLMPHLLELTSAGVKEFLAPGNPLRPLFMTYPRVWFYAVRDPNALQQWALSPDEDHEMEFIKDDIFKCPPDVFAFSRG